MAGDALKARLAREAWQCDAVGRRGDQAEKDGKETYPSEGRAHFLSVDP
jgi:hypothetical protein